MVMRRPSAHQTALLLLATVALLASGCRSRASRAKSEIIFPHAKHTGEADCSDCHGGIEKTTTAQAGKFIPNKKKCASCHEDEVKNQKKCRMCHVGEMKGSKIARGDLRKLRFNHAAHAKKKIANRMSVRRGTSRTDSRKA